MSHLLVLSLIAVFSYIAIVGSTILIGKITYRMRQTLRRQSAAPPTHEDGRAGHTVSWRTLTIGIIGIGFFTYAFIGADSLYNMRQYLHDVALVAGVLFIPFLILFHRYGPHLSLSPQEQPVFGALLFLSGLSATATLLLYINSSTGELLGRYPGTITAAGRSSSLFLLNETKEPSHRVAITIPVSPSGQPLAVQSIITDNELKADTLTITHYRGRLGYEWFSVGDAEHKATLFAL